MKKVFKLKGELVVFSLISFVISLNIAIEIKQQGIGFYNQTSNYRINKIYSETLDGLERDLINSNLYDTSQIRKLLVKKYGFDVGYSFYVVNSYGIITAGSNKGILTVDKSEITDGKKEYSESKTDKNIFKISGCDALKDGYYLYYVYLRYGEDDTGMIIYALIGSLICFLLLIWGRISYISQIKASVAKIAAGDLTQRVPFKYKNELRELAEDINFLALELENEDQRKNEFLTNISHDIRTPLTTILGYVDMIQKGKYDSSEEMSKYINIIERKGRFLGAMMEDFFQYSKLASKDITLNQQKIEMNELTRQLFEDEESEFIEKSLKLDLELSKEPIYICGDCEMIVRAVNNLFINALKYSKPDTVIKIKILQEKIHNVNYGTFSLSNIPKEPVSEELVECFFVRMYKKNSSRSDEGSGLGLSIVKNIVRLHNGRVTGSIEGEYINFKLAFRLP